MDSQWDVGSWRVKSPHWRNRIDIRGHPGPSFTSKHIQTHTVHSHVQWITAVFMVRLPSPSAASVPSCRGQSRTKWIVWCAMITRIIPLPRTVLAVSPYTSKEAVLSMLLRVDAYFHFSHCLYVTTTCVAAVPLLWHHLHLCIYPQAGI